MKKLLILFLLLSTTGCAGKYFYREVNDGIGGKTELLFAYGKFCGGGHPANLGEIGEDGKKRTLLSLYPPVDDIDAMCYAHDYCFKLADVNKRVCDDAFSWLTAINAIKISGMDCKDVLNDLSTAMFAKKSEKGDYMIETFAYRFAQTVVGIPSSLLLSGLNSPTKLLAISKSQEGECNVGDSPNPIKIIKSFERFYGRSVYNIIKRRKITIPIPKSAIVEAEKPTSQYKND